MSATARRWSLDEYVLLCEAALGAGYRARTVADYAGAPEEQPALVLRHDVDRRPWNSVRMAEREAQLGIRATYYVRMVPGTFDEAAVRAIASLGHEIGYHYEVLGTVRGDVSEALALFATELARLRAIAPVETASSHGSPLSPHDSLDIWRHAQPRDFGLTAEAYVSIDYARLAYFTDTGRAWDAGRTNLRDRTTGTEASPCVHTTAQLRDLLLGRTLPAVCVQTHPERWNATLAGHLRSAAWDHAANAAKLALGAIGRRRR